MLLALDVGNTNIVIGFLDESGIRKIFINICFIHI